MTASTQRLCLCFIILFGCGRQTNSSGERSVSPRSINLSGITLYQTVDTLQSVLHDLRCSQKDVDVKLCVWRPTDADRMFRFRGIDQVTLTLYRDSLQAISVHYLQMMDLEYKGFESGIRAKYSRSSGNATVDSTTTVWQYDSLIVTLIPNRKPHWTGSLQTFTPVLEFQERTLYRRWMEDIEKRKVNPVY